MLNGGDQPVVNQTYPFVWGTPAFTPAFTGGTRDDPASYFTTNSNCVVPVVNTGGVDYLYQYDPDTGSNGIPQVVAFNADDWLCRQVTSPYGDVARLGKAPFTDSDVDLHSDPRIDVFYVGSDAQVADGSTGWFQGLDSCPLPPPPP